MRICNFLLLFFAAAATAQAENTFFDVLRKGKGQEVQSYNSPLVRIKRGGSDPQVEILPLDEADWELRLGIIGMKEGEMRRLYLQPENGKPVTLDVEILKADASPDAHAASNHESTLPIFRNLDDERPYIR